MRILKLQANKQTKIFVFSCVCGAGGGGRRACVCPCVRACVRSCACPCVCACVCACVCVFILASKVNRRFKVHVCNCK